jgi:hypothetical protein
MTETAVKPQMRTARQAATKQRQRRRTTDEHGYAQIRQRRTTALEPFVAEYRDWDERRSATALLNADTIAVTETTSRKRRC